VRIGINGFGRIGRLVFRALWGRPGLELVHVNDSAGDAAAAAHLLEFDSVHGRWNRAVAAEADGGGFTVEGSRVGWSRGSDPALVPWQAAGVELVLECSGELDGVEIPNIVFGINHGTYVPDRHRILTAASCTTNCLAPVVKVVHGSFGIRHGSITTLHNITNTQVVIDSFKSDPRRARSCSQSLIPTTTGSAKAIGLIFPELQGKLNGHAVRVPLLNASLTDAVFELERPVTVEEVNDAFAAAAAAGPLLGILGYEERPLVSVDYVNDSRSSIVDALSTMVINGTQLKVYAWYDNEWGYSCRMADLACRVVALDAARAE